MPRQLLHALHISYFMIIFWGSLAGKNCSLTTGSAVLGKEAPSAPNTTPSASLFVFSTVHKARSMLAPLARRIALARPVATAFQSRPFSASSPPNDSGTSVAKIDTTVPNKDLGDYKRLSGAELFADHIDAAGRAELGKIRDIEDELIANVSAEFEPIDWEHWRKEIKHPGVVDELKVMHEETPPTDVEAEKMRVQKVVEDTFNPMLAELQKLTADAEVEAEEYEKKAEEMNYLHDNLSTMTVDEFLERYPTVKESIEKDIEDGKWFAEE